MSEQVDPDERDPTAVADTEGVDGEGAGPSGQTVAELAKRRGFFFPSNGIYGGTAGFYTWGPNGAAVKRHVEAAWRDRFTVKEGNQEIEAPTIMPEAVFEASGHLDGFDDMLVECPTCETSHRADHLLEDATDIADAERLTPAAVAERLAEHDIACPTCGTALAGQPVEPFNLMFETAIGPGSGEPGYLRPETAQGIFVEFPLLAEYARGQLPFGVTQIGPAYRNEISPRKSVIRVREFAQAELELFIDPETDMPDLEAVEDVTLTLLSVSQQESDDPTGRRLSVRTALEREIIADEWIAYYLGRAQEWFERIGVDPGRFRFRQHRPGERAHYAADCWDAEAELDGDWIELAGFADRGRYDLRRHADHSGEDFGVFKQFDEPIETEQAVVDPDMSALGPRFEGAAGDIAAELERLAERNPTAFEDGSGTVTVTVEGEDYEIPLEETGFAVETVTEAGEHVVPQVIEPSFGIDRIVYTVLDHAFFRDVVDGEERTVLGLEPAIAPTTVAVFPLQDRDGLGERARSIAEHLRSAGLEVTYDDSGNIGRRYRRQDEIGTPFCVTVDYETLDGPADRESVTIRDRDTTRQARVPTDGLADLLRSLRDGDRTFADVIDEYGPVEDADG